MQTLVDNHLLALLVVISVGYLVGKIRIRGFSLGIAAVLFAGLALSAVEPRIQIAPAVYELGLVLFVYTIGLASGPTFFAALRSRGLRINGVVALVLVVAVVEAGVLTLLVGLDKARAAGMFAGALTNTPALAAVLEALPRIDPTADTAAPVVGYSLAYPIGVLAPIAAIALFARFWRIDHDREALDAGVAARPLETWSVRIRTEERPVVHFLPDRCGAPVVVSRILHDKTLRLPEEDDILEPGDIVNLVGTVDDLEIAAEYLGERLETPLTRHDLDYRRIFVSNPAIVGVPLAKLDLRRKHDILVTRIRRGDVDMVAHDESVLQLGDRVRVVAPAEKMDEATDLIGDSYRRLSEIDILTFAFGITLGLLVGMIPIALPTGGELRLGPAGGPLLVALALGTVGRTGRFIWRIPYSSNLTIRQLGLVLFLAGVGIKAGPGFARALTDPGFLALMGAGAGITITTSLLVLVIAHKVMRLPFGQAAGLLAGAQTQPAALVFASEQARNELPTLGYTTVYPMAMVMKIILAQLLVVLLIG